MIDNPYYWGMQERDRMVEDMVDGQYYWDMSDRDRVTENMADSQYYRDMSDSDSECDRLYTITFLNEERIVVTKEQYALLKSVEVEDINAIRRYTRKGGDLNIQFNNGATLLQIAIENGKISALQGLLQLGANPDKKGVRVYRHLPKASEPRSYTPMETAALCEQTEAIRILFEYGANPDIVGEDGRTALLLSTYHGCESSAYVLRGLPAPQVKCTWAHYRIMNAIHFSNEDELTRLLQDKVDPNFVTSDGCSPLFAAIENDFYKCIKILLDYGANANMLCKRAYPCEYVQGSEDPRNWTPLECAVIYDNIDYMLLLIAYGANVYYSDVDGKNALSTAYAYRRLAVIQFLEYYIAGIHGPRESEILLKAIDKRDQKPYDCSIEPEYLSEEPDQYKSMTNPDGTHNWDVYEPWMNVPSGYIESSDSSVTHEIESKYKNLCDWWPYPLLDQKEISASCVTDDKSLEKAIEFIHRYDYKKPHCSYTYGSTYKVTHVGIAGSDTDTDTDTDTASCVTDDKSMKKVIEEPHSSYTYASTSHFTPEVIHESDYQEPHCSYTYGSTYKVTHAGIDGSETDTDTDTDTASCVTDDKSMKKIIEEPHSSYKYASTSQFTPEVIHESDYQEPHCSYTYGSTYVTHVGIGGSDTETKSLKSGKGLKRKKIGKYLKKQEDETSEKPKQDEKHEHSEQAGDGGKDENVEEEKKDKKSKDHIEEECFDWYEDWFKENKGKLRQEIISPTEEESEEYEVQWILDTQSKEEVTTTQKETGKDKKLMTKLADQEKKDVTEKKDDGTSDAQKTKYKEKGTEVQEIAQSTKETGVTTKKEGSKIKPKPADQGAVLEPIYEEEEGFIDF